MSADHWVELSRGLSLTIAPQRRLHGVSRPPRFLVLAPAREPDRLRPTLCVGDFVAGRCVVDHGVLDEALRPELEKACAKALLRASRPARNLPPPQAARVPTEAELDALERELAELGPAPTLDARLPGCSDAELSLLLDFFDGPTTPETLRRNFKSFIARVRVEVRRRR